eukprot:jgi/Chlat1/5650/Chrsp37S05475
MSAKKKAMSLKDFHGGSIKTELGLPSKPGSSADPNFSYAYRQSKQHGSYGGYNGQPGSFVGSPLNNNNFRDSPITSRGHYDEDERRPGSGSTSSQYSSYAHHQPVHMPPPREYGVEGQGRLAEPQPWPAPTYSKAASVAAPSAPRDSYASSPHNGALASRSPATNPPWKGAAAGPPAGTSYGAYPHEYAARSDRGIMDPASSYSKSGAVAGWSTNAIAPEFKSKLIGDYPREDLDRMATNDHHSYPHHISSADIALHGAEPQDVLQRVYTQGHPGDAQGHGNGVNQMASRLTRVKLPSSPGHPLPADQSLSYTSMPGGPPGRFQSALIDIPGASTPSKQWRQEPSPHSWSSATSASHYASQPATENAVRFFNEQREQSPSEHPAWTPRSQQLGLDTAKEASPSKERPKLNLKPRTTPKTEVTTASGVRPSSVFGAARPREEVLKEQGREDPLKRVEQEKEFTPTQARKLRFHDDEGDHWRGNDPHQSRSAPASHFNSALVDLPAGVGADIEGLLPRTFSGGPKVHEQHAGASHWQHAFNGKSKRTGRDVIPQDDIDPAVMHHQSSLIHHGSRGF